MHPDLPKLLDVQSKDRSLAELRSTLDELANEREALDAALETARSQIANASRAAEDSAGKRDERVKKLEIQRTMQDRRRERLEQERNPRVAAQLMADLDLGRGILAQEESEWLRLAEDATQRENSVTEGTTYLESLEAEQAEIRGDLEGRIAEAKEAHDAARAERDAAAEGLEKTLRMRYTRLRSARKTEVLVLATGGTCTACYTSIPTSRAGQLMADGILIDGCEMCGAILYTEEVTA